VERLSAFLATSPARSAMSMSVGVERDGSSLRSWMSRSRAAAEMLRGLPLSLRTVRINP
jgi:hypothetical protein